MLQKKNKEKVLGIRLEENDYQQFSTFCEKNSIKMSQIGRKAILTYVYLNFNPLVNPKLIFAKNQFKYIIQCLNEEQIANLAEISIANGIGDMKKLETYHPKIILENQSKTEINYQMETLTKYVFSDEGENWFEQINYTFQDDDLIINGTHSLGTNFSTYIRELLQRYTIIHGYLLVEEVSTSKYLNDQRTFHILMKFSPKSKKT
ncbi:hypothetical protein DSAG12_00838 [Promethearchaeum syntrophicum]|uniref:Uncharacterized protein n=1 Tax=Promethearchaeum syntrophicum TaxID=2594042 RepID=A0A5B9D7P1_9ARCH|nr:hypothetical protein [Candidatus Prometheoarchaeum syntrophicum]QEE15015.1 hypothetical protein DSAG12_00838 [Candidatus Prometheoarchaeum syntrophicum]